MNLNKEYEAHIIFQISFLNLFLKNFYKNNTKLQK